MPFFYDLYTLTGALGADAAEADKIPAEIIPYTQAVYYDATEPTSPADEKNFGNENYQLLFLAPWSGQPNTRQAEITCEWNISENFRHRIENSLDRTTFLARIRQLQYQQDVLDRIKYNQSKGTNLSGRALQAWNGSFLKNAILYLFDEEVAKKFVTAAELTENQFNKIKDNIKNFLQGEINKESEASSTSGGTTAESGQTPNFMPQDLGVQEFDASKMKAQLNAVNVKMDLEEDDMSITKSIVCKSSDATSAANCLKELAFYLSKVSPYFFRLNENKSVAQQGSTWSRINIAYMPPNNFAVYQGDAKTGTGAKRAGFDIFSYRGEFQLRKGYTVHRNLVPKEIKIVASPDNLLLEENPFEKLNDVEDYSKSNTVKNTNLANKAEAKVVPANTKDILSQWKSSGLYQKIYLYGDDKDGKVGYLFPQWINLSITFNHVEPFDGITSAQQLFCFSDKCLKLQNHSK